MPSGILTPARERLTGWVAWLVAWIICQTRTLRSRARLVRIVGKVGNSMLRLFPSLYDGHDTYKRQYAHGTVRNMRQGRHLCSVLQKAEREGLSPREALRMVGVEPEGESKLTPELAAQVFEDAPEGVNEIAIQFSGGADSTAAAVLAAQRFDRVHLLTFRHSFIEKPEESWQNARKLSEIFGEDAISYIVVDATADIEEILFRDYGSDRQKYGTSPMTDPCLGCKLSFDTSTIRYCRRNGVKLVGDGADLRVQFQLSQGNREIMALRQQLYNDYDLDFVHPVAEIDNSIRELLLFGLHTQPGCLIYPTQPQCVGVDIVAPAYKRFYYLPKYGMSELQRFGEMWAAQKLEICRELLDSV